MELSASRLASRSRFATPDTSVYHLSRASSRVMRAGTMRSDLGPGRGRSPISGARSLPSPADLSMELYHSSSSAAVCAFFSAEERADLRWWWRSVPRANALVVRSWVERAPSLGSATVPAPLKAAPMAVPAVNTSANTASAMNQEEKTTARGENLLSRRSPFRRPATRGGERRVSEGDAGGTARVSDVAGVGPRTPVEKNANDDGSPRGRRKGIARARRARTNLAPHRQEFRTTWCERSSATPEMSRGDDMARQRRRRATRSARSPPRNTRQHYGRPKSERNRVTAKR